MSSEACANDRLDEADLEAFTEIDDAERAFEVRSWVAEAALSMTVAQRVGELALKHTNELGSRGERHGTQLLLGEPLGGQQRGLRKAMERRLRRPEEHIGGIPSAGQDSAACSTIKFAMFRHQEP